jgi:hypothetical protein
MNTQLHQRCVTYKVIMSVFKSQGDLYMGILYDARDAATEIPMRNACALFDTPVPNMPRYLEPLSGERLAILKLDETHGG